VGLTVALLIILAGEWWQAADPPLRRSDWPSEAQWIRTSDEIQSTACFRHDFILTDNCKHAWVKIAAQGGFELTVNSDPVGGWTFWRPTRPFQNGLTASGQRISESDPAMALNFPREYQWASHSNSKTPVYFDIRPYLRVGRNVICIETEARTPMPAVILTGEIHLGSGRRVPLATNCAWLAEPVPVGCTQDEWVQPGVGTQGWRMAVEWNRGPRSGAQVIPLGTFEVPFNGEWIGLSPLSANRPGFEDLVLRWNQDQPPDDAFLRIASTAPYAIFLNGKAVTSDGRARSRFNDGGWLVTWDARRPLATPPVLLDPDETEDPFAGHRFETPRHGNPTINDFKRHENNLNRSKDKPNASGVLDAAGDSSRGEEAVARSPDPYGYDEEAILTPPLEVARNRNLKTFLGYGITGLIRHGENELRIRLVPEPDTGYHRTKTRRIAADMVVAKSGVVETILATGTSLWRTEKDGHSAATCAFDSEDESNQLPPLIFVGDGWPKSLWKALAACIGFGFFLVMLRLRIPRGWVIHCAWFCAAALVAFALRASFLERSEALWFRDLHWAIWVLGAALIVAFVAPALLRITSKCSSHGGGKRTLALVFLLGVTFLVRAWQIDAQPIDDDEFASIQGTCGIVQTGAPTIGRGIWYTRSPLYHYAAAAAAWVGGANLWTLRLFSVLTAVATGAVVWALGRLCFRNHWISVGALILFGLHPYLIFTAHIARFYQQQQLLVMLTYLCLIRGFIQNHGPRWMVATVFAFGAALLSQEISMSLIPGIFITYLLFGSSLPWRWELKVGLAGMMVVALFVIDIAAFQMKCLTWTAGISPNVEATIAPNFWELGNLTSMFIGYSRLHLLASAFLPFSVLAAVRRGDRSVLALHSLLYSGILSINLFITSVSFRYQYALIPLWILLCVHGIHEASRIVAVKLRPSGALRRTGPALAAISGVAVICSWSPWRIPGSYAEKLLGDSNTPLRYVHANLRPTDKVMITEPHPHAARMELDRVDYDLALPILYDFAYWDDGILRDRNGDARVINRLAQLQELFASDERIWIVINREKLRSRTRNLRWEYPGAREEYFIRRNCHLAFRSYLWHVYLWDRNAQRYHAFRSEPNGWSE
jgi:hypothetical protein